ncbi:MAG: hypothetical protein CMH53_10790 [Myxococcales bacterium]|nr:hypothetical protein [Myxococcales bacterium]
MIGHRVRSLILVIVMAAMCSGCARLNRQVSLRVEPLQAPQHQVQVIGKGLKLSAQRQGDHLVVQAQAVEYCQKVTKQRALGFRVVRTEPVGRSLLYQWIMGGLITATSAGLMTYNAMSDPPVEDQLQLDYRRRGWIYSGAIAVAGLALLTGSWVQQLSVGIEERPIGKRVLEKKASVSACHHGAAVSGQLRLTLDIGVTLMAQVGADGQARFALTSQLQNRLKAGSRRATLEAIGDWRSQIRVQL